MWFDSVKARGPVRFKHQGQLGSSHGPFTSKSPWPTQIGSNAAGSSTRHPLTWYLESASLTVAARGLCWHLAGAFHLPAPVFATPVCNTTRAPDCAVSRRCNCSGGVWTGVLESASGGVGRPAYREPSTRRQFSRPRWLLHRLPTHKDELKVAGSSHACNALRSPP